MTNKERFIGKDSIDLARNLIRFSMSMSCPAWNTCKLSKDGDCRQLKSNVCEVQIAKWLDGEE